jgi:arylsulfatase A-like enzyme
MIHIPLVIRTARPGTAVFDAASISDNVDLYPTILDLVGLPQPAGLEGQSLMTSGRPREKGFARSYSLNFEHVSVRSLTAKYIRNRSGPGEYNSLASDPSESRNLASAAQASREMASQLDKLEEQETAPPGLPTPANPALSSERIRELKALGYLNGSTPRN